MLVDVAEGRALPAAEGVVGHGHRDRHVDADHAHVHPRCELARGAAVAGEDGDAVAVLVVGRERQRLLEGLGADDLQDRPEDLLLVGLHRGLHLVEQARAQEEAVLVALQLEAAAVDDQLGAFLHAQVDVVADLLLVGLGDDRAVLGGGVGGEADLERVQFGQDAFAHLVGGLLAHRHDDGQGHAALAGRAVGRADDVLGGLLQVGVGQDDPVVLGPAHGLDALTVGRAAAIDIVGDVGGAHEAHRLDVGVVEDGVDGGLVAMDHVQHAARRAGLHHQLGQADRQRRVLLRRLEDKGVARRDGDPEHPHRDHAREVERGDAGGHAQRLAHGIDVDAGARALGVLALQRMRDAAGELDDLEAALDVALGVGDDLAVLGREQLGQLVHARFHEALELEHDPRAALRIDQRPGLLRPQRRLDGAVHLGLGGQLDAGLDLAGVGVEHVAVAARSAGEGGAVDEMGDLTHGAAFRPEPVAGPEFRCG